MATIFWDSDGVILTDFLEGERTITASYYKAVLRKLKTALARKRGGKLHLSVLFHHDNALAHSSRTVRTVLREFRWEVIPHPPYSSDVAPSDFSSAYATLRWRRFAGDVLSAMSCRLRASGTMLMQATISRLTIHTIGKFQCRWLIAIGSTAQSATQRCVTTIALAAFVRTSSLAVCRFRFVPFGSP
ncbi:hypothetical protein M514_07286 [Trichuris suis]|uniref:Mariner Mos1 transposase n=1 Tax=Trichuris suis TaxID=68888 RepID=A0A085N414_9BILA|nr:hypothetical protein M514_07286 [Trichuris suis]